jgi:hypothetical protein
MIEEATAALSLKVEEMTRDLKLDAGRAALPEEAMDRWSRVFETVPPEERRLLCRDVLAFALHLNAEAGDAARPALEQLSNLCAILLVSGKAARALFEAAGLEAADRSKTITGQESSNRPVEKAADLQSSPLFARFGGAKSEKK